MSLPSSLGLKSPLFYFALSCQLSICHSGKPSALHLDRLQSGFTPVATFYVNWSRFKERHVCLGINTNSPPFQRRRCESVGMQSLAYHSTDEQTGAEDPVS